MMNSYVDKLYDLSTFIAFLNTSRMLPTSEFSASSFCTRSTKTTCRVTLTCNIHIYKYQRENIGFGI